MADNLERFKSELIQRIKLIRDRYEAEMVKYSKDRNGTAETCGCLLEQDVRCDILGT